MKKKITIFSNPKIDMLLARITDDSVESGERKACFRQLDKQICKANGIKRELISGDEMHDIRGSVMHFYLNYKHNRWYKKPENRF